MSYRPRLVILISGTGTNLNEILSANSRYVLNVDIVHVISNKSDAPGLLFAKNYGVPSTVMKIHGLTREEYDINLSQFMETLNPDLIILAGWMRILTSNFLSKWSGITINLHPALPGMFIGKDAIGDAWRSFREKRITHTGIMVHRVVEEIDVGEVLTTRKVEIYSDDTEDTLRNRIRYFEKHVLLETIQRLCDEIRDSHKLKYPVYHGKVSNVYDKG